MSTENKIIVITEFDFTRLVRDIVREELKIALVDISKPKIYTRKETALEILKCSLVHLWNETKKGKIKSTNVGNKVMYRAEDIQYYLSNSKFKPKKT